MNRINSIYIAALLLCVNSMNTVLKVTELERNMFYRHKAALMYDSRAAIQAFTIAELPFIFLAATIFVMLFYWIMVSDTSRSRYFTSWTRPSNFCFWLFFVFVLSNTGLSVCLNSRELMDGLSAVNHLFGRNQLKSTMPTLMRSLFHFFYFW
jgi:ABC-type multidrug transport system permease subunit